MRFYRFSPIRDKDELFEAIQHIHYECFKLCKQSFMHHLPVAGNMGVFCHYDNEYELLTRIREELCEPSDEPKQKYFVIRNPIVIPAKNDVPETTYTHLYIRKPDIYRAQVGDVDFVIGEKEYGKLKVSLLNGGTIKGARIFPRADLDMIELFDPDIDALAYVSPREITEKVRIKLV